MMILKNTCKEVKKNSHIFLSFILAIFPISVFFDCYWGVINEFEYGRNIDSLKIAFAYVLIFLMTGLIIILMFTMKGFVRENAEKYSLFFILGIKKMDFWKVIFRDFFRVLLLIGALSTLVCNGVSLGLISIIMKRKNGIEPGQLLQEYFVSVGCVLTIIIITIILVICFVAFYFKRNEMIEFWENQNKNLTVVKHNIFLYFFKPVLGIATGILAIVLCFNHATLYVAAILQVVAIYCLSTSIECLRFIFKINENQYYKNIISFHSVVYQYKTNSRIIINIYLLSFIIAFVVGGFILSDVSDRYNRNYNERYPYDNVIVGNSINEDNIQLYPFVECVAIYENKKDTIISLSSYEKIVPNSSYVLSDNEILFISQHEAESFSPTEGKNDLLLGIYNGMDEIDKTYMIKASKWETVFGENILPQFENIIVVNDTQFEEIAQDRKYIGLGTLTEDLTGDDLYVWNKKTTVEEEIDCENYTLILLYIMGIFLIVESQGIVLIKQIVNRGMIERKYKLLRTLGGTKKFVKKEFFKEVKSVTFLPTIGGFATGGLFLWIDCLYQGGLTINMGLFYFMLWGIGLLLQYVGYYCVAVMLCKIYRIAE